MTDGAHIAIADTCEVAACGFSIGIFIYLTVAHSTGQGQGHAHFTVNISQTVTDRANIVIGTNMDMAFQLAYLQMTLCHYTKVKVKVKNISTVNISKMVTDVRD